MRYAEIRTDYVDEKTNECYIDTWKTDNDNEEGHTVATVNLNNGNITWLDKSPQVLSNPQVIEAIADVLHDNDVDIFS